MGERGTSLERAHQAALFEDHAPAGEYRAGPGRPRGALNRKSRDLAKYLAARGYSDPAEALAVVYSLEGAGDPVERLAAKVKRLASELGIKREAALSAVMQAARDAMPYHHAKRPVAVQVDSPIPLVMVDERTGRALDQGEAEANETLMGQILDLVEKSGTYEVEDD